MKGYDIIASIGGGVILLAAFLLNLYKQLPVCTRLYGSLNFIGAAVCCYAAYRVNFYPFIILEGAWTAFGLLALLRNPK